MIGVYKGNNKNYNKNPDMILMPISCKLKRELNTGINEIELVHDIDKLGRWKYLKCDNILCIPTPTSDKQLYVIYDKDTDSSDNTITVKAESLYFRLINKQLFSCSLANVNGQEALNSILTGTSFTGYSNIITRKNVDFSYMNALQAINGNKDNNFISVFGGELDTDNFNVTINNQIGSDNGVRAEFGFNLDSIEENINYENIWTRLIPISNDGILLDSSTPWIDSPLINSYDEIKSNFVVFQDAKLKAKNEDGTINEKDEGYNTIEELRQAMIEKCNKLFSDGIDTPSVNYKVNIVSLENTTAYNKYKNLLKINLGDVVHTKHIELNIEDIRVRCISYEYDCLTRKYDEIELGKYVANYVDMQNEINETLKTESKIHSDKLNAVIQNGGNEGSWELSESAFRVCFKGSSNGYSQIDGEGITIYDGRFRIMKGTNQVFKVNNDGYATAVGAFTVERDGEGNYCSIDSGGLEISNDNGYTGRLECHPDKTGLYIPDDLITSDLAVEDFCKIGGNCRVNDDLNVFGDFDVDGEKNCLQTTKNYGKRRINAFETCEYYFSDCGFGYINHDGECVVYIDDIFSECVNTNIDYHVYTQKYSRDGNIEGIEENQNYFIVYGKPNTYFSWKIEAKRIGYENNRLEKPLIKSEINNELESILLERNDV